MLHPPLSLLLAIAASLLSFASSAQDYPTRPLRIFAPPVGGPGDFVARQMAQGISPQLGQPVVVENRVALVSAETVSKAPADGYTLLLGGGGIWITTLLRKMSYDMITDFSPVIMITKEVNVLLVHPSLPVKAVKDLIALARSKPGQLNYGSSGTGSSFHLAGELFKIMANADIVHIAYKGASLAVTSLLAGETQMTITGAGTVLGHMQAGRLRGLAVTSAERSALLPALPTVASTLPGFEAVGVTGVWVPVKTPVSVIARLNQEIQRYLSRPDVKEGFFVRASEVVGGPSETLGAFVRSDIALMAKTIRQAGIREE